jgi:hypothetical protein
MGSLVSRCRARCGSSAPQDVQLSTSLNSKKSSLFVNAQPSRDIIPLLKTDNSAVKVSDSSSDSFDQDMIAALLAEKTNLNDEP